MSYNSPMIDTTHLQQKDIDKAIISINDQGGLYATPGWDLGEATRVTFRNLIDLHRLPKTEDPEIKATEAITEAIETGYHLMRMAFIPTELQLLEIMDQFRDVGKNLPSNLHL